MNADAWRERLAKLPTREIDRLLKAEPALTAQISAGFRPGPETLKNPVVLRRLAEVLPKNPKLADALEEVGANESQPADTKPKKPETNEPVATKSSPDTSERQKLKELRKALKEREAQLAELATQLAQRERERDLALQERDELKKAQLALEARLEREKRRKTPEPVVTVAPTPAVSVPAEPFPDTPEWVPDALVRLLQRGHDAGVLMLCRELLGDRDLPLVARAGVQGVYATALANLGASEASTELQSACEAFLSVGRVVEAGECLVRSLVRPTPSKSERALLQRLLALAERRGERETLGLALARLRRTEPFGFGCLLKGLESLGGGAAELLPRPTRAVSVPGLNEAVVLAPGLTVRPRELIQAVEEGDASRIRAVREALLAESGGAEPLREVLAQHAPPTLAVLSARRLRPIVVDASNVARYIADPMEAVLRAKKKPVGSLSQLLRVRDFLFQHGFFPVLLLADANLRHIVTEKAAYAALVERHVIQETLPGTSADELLLREAHAHRAPLLTNDRLADWGERAAGIERLGFLIHSGGVSLLPS